MQRTTFKLYSPTLIPSDESLVMADLKRLKYDKWGYVVYRCTYKDDAAWGHFKQTIYQQTRQDLRESDTPELAEHVEWTFVEDREALDGVPIPRLRERFNRWAAKAVVAENPRAQAGTEGRSTIVGGRYNCFVHVDEEALQSVLRGPERENEYGELAHVNFVDALWEPYGDSHFEGGYEPDILEPIDGCTEGNVGWMRMSVHLVFSAYIYVGAGDSTHWHLFYRRPPDIVF